MRNVADAAGCLGVTDNLLFLKDVWNNHGMFQAGILLNTGPNPELVRKTVKPNKTKDDPFWITFRENLAARLDASEIAENRLELMIGAYRGHLSHLKRGSSFILPGDEQLVRLAKFLRFLPSELHSDFSRLDQRVMEEIREEPSPKDWLPVQIVFGETKETVNPAEPLCEKPAPQEGPHTERRPVMKKTMNKPEAQVDETLPVYARNIQALAARTGLSQAELARRANISRDAFHRYAIGKTRPPVDKVYKIADLFRVTPSEIDPERTYIKQQRYVGTLAGQPYKISDTSDCDLVSFELFMDLRPDTMTEMLSFLHRERAFQLAYYGAEALALWGRPVMSRADRPSHRRDRPVERVILEDQLPVWAQNLRNLSVGTGCSDAELARQSGMSRDAFHRYVSGKTRPPVEKVYRLADFFGVAPEDIDPGRRYVSRPAQELATARFYTVAPPSSGDPTLVYFHFKMDMRHGTLAKILDLVADERRWLNERALAEAASA